MTAYRMRPWYLRSALFPFVSGVVALVLGLVVGNAGTVVGIGITMVVAGIGWWALVSRPRTAKLLREADGAPAPAAEVEPRDNPPGVGTFVLFTAFALCGLLSPSVSGLLFGMALAHAADYVRIGRWEREHGGELVATRDGYTTVPT